MSKSKPVHVIGGGLAGSEAAWQIARAGVPVVLHEMRPMRKTDAHQGEGLAELVCSNSFRSDDAESNAVGLLHEELRRCHSLIMRAADIAKVPAGGALAVDRDVFSGEVQKAIEAEPLIELRREEVAGIPPAEWDSVIVATGPLTSPALAKAVRDVTGEQSLAFFDAIAPIVYRDSIDMDKAWFQSRYDKVGPGGAGEQDEGDYINCPFEKPNYLEFHAALLAAGKTEFKDWEKNTPYFDGRARAANPDFRADETGRSDRPTHWPPPLCGRAAASGQQTRHALQYGRLPDQDEACGAGAHLSYDSRSGEYTIRTAGRHPPQYLS